MALLVPVSAQAIFPGAWLAAALAQPANALSFVTDGIHWGTRDYRYLRNGMLAATVTGTGLLFFVDTGADDALTSIWIVSAVWIAVRTVFGAARIWPGVGHSPLSER